MYHNWRLNLLLCYCKESGASSQPLVSSGAVERIGSSFLESSLSTRDALDKYQIVAQKVVPDLHSSGCFSVYPI